MAKWSDIGYRNKLLKAADRVENMRKKGYSAEELKRQRDNLGLTQKDLSVALCVSVRTVVSWETGTRNMPLCCQRLFCMLYGLPFELPREPIEDLTPDLFDIDSLE